MGNTDDRRSERDLFTTYAEAEQFGAYRLATRWTAIRAAEQTVATEVDELATMAALRTWLTRWLPMQVHRVLLLGGTVDQAAAAAGLTHEEITAAWRDWAAGQRRLQETLPDLPDRSEQYDAVELVLAAAEAARKAGPTDA